MLVKTNYLKLEKPFVTEGRRELKEAIVAYEEYGKKDGPVVFIAHGGLSSMHAAGKHSEDDKQSGFWDWLIGPGKTIDTNRYRVLCTNALGSMFGSCSPLTTDPDTGKIYGASFPKITLVDQVRFQKAFLDQLGVNELHLMLGPSMGSLHTLTMAALYPEFVKAIISIATAGRTPPPALTVHHFMMNAIKLDPQFKEGKYDTEEPLNNLRLIYQLSKFFYTAEAVIKEATWDSVSQGPEAQYKRSDNVNAYLSAGQEERIRQWDPNSMISVLSAINTHDLGRDASSYEEGVQRINCPVLLMNMDTDGEFQPCWAQEVANIINEKQPGQARAEVITSKWGHLGCLFETKQLGDHIKSFISHHEL